MRRFPTMKLCRQREFELTNSDPLPVTGNPKIDTALQGPIAEFKRKRAWFLVGFVVSVAAFFFFFFNVLESSETGNRIFFFVVSTIVLAGILNARFGKELSRKILPKVVTEFGFSYRPFAGYAPDLVKTGLLPNHTVKVAEDWISGDVSGRRLEAAEVEIVTGHKNKKRLFRGLVVSFQNPGPEDWLVIGKEAETKPGLFSGPLLGLKNLYEVHRVQSGSGQEFRVFMADPEQVIEPRIEGFLDALIRLDSLDGFRLYSVVRTYDTTHVALSNQRDLFSLGGLFFTPSSLQRKLSGALAELSIPLKVAEGLLAAEAAHPIENKR